jgi:hypothetical protein
MALDVVEEQVLTCARVCAARRLRQRVALKCVGGDDKRGRRFGLPLLLNAQLRIEVMEEGPSDVDDEPRLGLSEERSIRMRHAPLVPDRQKGIKNAGGGIENGLDILGAWTKVCKPGMPGLQLPKKGDHGVSVPMRDAGTVADSDEVSVKRRVDPVNRARRSRRTDEVLSVGYGSKHNVARDLRGATCDERSRLQALDQGQELDMSSRAGVGASGLVWREPLDNAPQHLRLVPG